MLATMLVTIWDTRSIIVSLLLCIHVLYGANKYIYDSVNHSKVASIFNVPIITSSSSSSLGSRCVPWLGEGLSMPSPNYPVLCFPLPYRIAPVFV